MRDALDFDNDCVHARLKVSTKIGEIVNASVLMLGRVLDQSGRRKVRGWETISSVSARSKAAADTNLCFDRGLAWL